MIELPGLASDISAQLLERRGREPGSLGIGWSHNWASRLVVTPCGEIVVSGGEGGRMRFVDDGEGGLRPLRGQHGTLVRSEGEDSLDLYTKAGNRYHRRLFGTPQYEHAGMGLGRRPAAEPYRWERCDDHV